MARPEHWPCDSWRFEAMRFGDGAWRMLDDVTPHYLSRVDGVEVSERALELDVTNKLDEARWATLDGHMFSVRITSPMPNVFRIQTRHHKGRREHGPHYDINDQPQAL